MIPFLANYPDWVCADCGTRYGRKEVGVATWHKGECGICHQKVMVTEPAQVGHLKTDWYQQHAARSGTDHKNDAPAVAG